MDALLDVLYILLLLALFIAPLFKKDKNKKQQANTQGPIAPIEDIENDISWWNDNGTDNQPEIKHVDIEPVDSELSTWRPMSHEPMQSSFHDELIGQSKNTVTPTPIVISNNITKPLKKESKYEIELAAETPRDDNDVFADFDLRKAVIFSEILKPKF